MDDFQGSERPAPDGMSRPDTDEPGSVELCITIAKDGSLSVYKEAEGQESARQPADDITQALKMVLMLYREASPTADAEDQMRAGYGEPMQPKRPTTPADRSMV